MIMPTSTNFNDRKKTSQNLREDLYAIWTIIVIFICFPRFCTSFMADVDKILAYAERNGVYGKTSSRWRDLSETTHTHLRLENSPQEFSK